MNSRLARQMSVGSLVSVAGCLEAMGRRNKVNPAENHIDINDGRWEQKGSSTLPSQLGASACLTPESEASGDSVTLAADAAHGLGGNPCTRKSSKAKRVKNYLKKCKNAALGNSGGGHGEEQELRTDSAVERERPEAPRVRVSRRRSGSGNRDVSSTSWYVPTDPKPPPNLVSVVEVLPPGHADEPASDNANSAVIETVSDSVCSASHPSQNDPGDVLDSRNEGGTMVVTLESQNESTPSSCLVEDDPKSLNLPSRDNQIDAVPNSHESSENKCDVATLVERYLGSLYPNFPRVRPILVRQARDLLVCTFHGNLARFECEFCVPASQLLREVRDIADRKSGDVVAPRGWPLSLGSSGVILQLGELDPTLLRNRDCYLCVRRGTGPRVEVAFVWKCEAFLSSRALAVTSPPHSALETPVTLEMAATDEGQDLPGLLQSLLVSVERAIERVPLDVLAFPCPRCRDEVIAEDNGVVCGCQCVCQQQSHVEKKDTSIQTSPMFEFVGSIPHIDSDEENDSAHEPDGTTRNSDLRSRDVVIMNRPELVTSPKRIVELPEKLLMSGIHLPGTSDLKERPLVVVDAATVLKASLDSKQIASVLLYYASLPRPEKLKDGFTVLILCAESEGSALDLLDKALSLVAAQMNIGNVLLWRPPSTSDRWQLNHDVLENSRFKVHVVTDERDLCQYISEDQTPVNCGGRSTHDQVEWVEFYKEVEPFLGQCHACGRRLVSVMSELRSTEGQRQVTRRQLHHQHRALTRALTDPELQRLRREGNATLARLEERSQWLPASEDVRLSAERARRLFVEVDRAARRLEQLAEGRRERLRDLARVRALEDEATQVLSWLCRKGDETLKRHTELATNLPAIKEQELDFEKFYFISMRHLDKGSDLLEEAGQCGNDARNSGSISSSSGLKELARSLKQHLRGFSERLEDTRERLEDTSRCFYLLDKAYEWALEMSKYMSRVKADDTQSPVQTLQVMKHLQQYLMAHPPIAEDHFTEMMQLARRLGNEKLMEQAKVAQARCQETMELIQAQQSRLVQARRQQGVYDRDESFCSSLDRSCIRPLSPKSIHQGWNTSGVVTSTPAGSVGVGRRRSVGSFPYIYKCNHDAAGHACSCWDPVPSSVLEESQDCCCNGSGPRPNNLGNIQEVRESAEDLLDSDGLALGKDEDDVCVRCGNPSALDQRCDGNGARQIYKRHLRRSCTWQYPTENFDDEDPSCNGGSVGSDSGTRLCGASDDHKYDYATDNSGDNTTEGSDGFTKSGEDLEEQDGSGVVNKPVPPVTVNSHLHCCASKLDLAATAPGSKELKTQKTFLLIMREMVQTERDYVKSLEYIIENYIPELLREDIPQALRGQRNVIFGNVEKIYEFHSQYFLQELEKCENSPHLVGQCFLRHEKKFYLYALYNKNKPKSDSLMSEYGTSFFKTKQVELGDKMDLASYLLKPVQRMGKYALLLQQLMKAYPDKEVDVTDIRAAEQMVRFQLRHGNDLLAMDSLRDCDVNVKEQGRLLRQNEFLVWQGKGKKCLRHVFLFEELILFSKARRFPDRKNLDLYIYKNSIKMTDIGLTAKIGDSTTKFEIWFRKRKPNDTFTLQSMSEEIKQVWTEEISKLLWKQALRNREMRLAEMSSMGIGNKPCLDIRPSADQISDRSISIAQLSKTAPRFRNSITVSSGELLRSNKRPHSIISVSSSSSGGSSSSTTSHSSASGYGPLINLGFDPADSPHMHHRSTTLNSQCSMESGIIADISLGSEDTDGSGNHWHVERSNSSVTSASLDSSMSPTSPVSPTDEDKNCLAPNQAKENNSAQDLETDQEELTIKL
ncbi:uncharacterized protein LOC110831512 isoform X4 [Zootermopsis nevadensis]|uniref:uncharacterized protein LOC110831512 isoform X4 n=1 Tax=Zootermopsis nevadensis TaxID=136037 RepID=UPI000B8EE668|nr:uncharacterized protein LOC110831512 isoform X4 [Zootermopsis nevadensis]